MTHLPATLWGTLLVSLLLTASALLSFSLLRRAWRVPRRWETAALLFFAVVLFGAVPARDFGQRDHLVSFLLLPYVLAAAVPGPTIPSRDRIAAGIFAALAICLKPHHALVPITVETALLLFPNFPGAPSVTALPSRMGSNDARTLKDRLSNMLRPEPVLIFIGGAIYLAVIHHFAPLYFAQAIPLTRQVYGAIGHLTLPQLLWEAIELCLLAAIAVGLLTNQRAASPAARLLLLAGGASFAAYLIQGTGWYYQQLPAISFFGVALALQLLDLATSHPLNIPTWLPKAAAALVVLAFALTTHFTGYPFTEDRAFAIDTPDPALFRSLQPGTPVAILTTSVDEAMMPVERYHLTWAQRTNNLWLLPEVLRAERPEGQPARHTPTPAQLAELDALNHRWMVEDLIHWQPQLVLVERCQDEDVRCQVLEDRHDDLLAWFQRDPAFSALWQQHYSLQRQDDRFDVYTRK